MRRGLERDMLERGPSLADALEAPTSQERRIRRAEEWKPGTRAASVATFHEWRRSSTLGAKRGVRDGGAS